MRHSSFGDAYRGQKFIIRISAEENGFTTELQVGELPSHKDSDNLWSTRDEAINAGIKEARDIIDKMTP
ncbi:hypothetical protein [Pseudomonas sp. TWR1-1-4]|uniref:hypothetical protein n=1 Tax=Pseudomonas sp. TWR1-1-4 TaxID=2804604 RepID=UPI003CF4CC02